jgi:hypothetical protein
MHEDKYNQLIDKLNSQINSFRKQLVSPAQKSGDVYDTPDLLITKELDVESLSKNEQLLIHSMLHKFYGRKAQGVTKKDIEQLHKKVVKNIKHSRFDALDDTL